ncbi:MAG TPA: ABC transporter substrate-binding protein [Burkholderiales bacterium]
MTTRRETLRLVAGIGLCAALGAQAARLPRIGYLLLGPVYDTPSVERRAFLDGLRALGHVADRTIEIIYKSAEGETVFLDATIRELIDLRPDVIVVSSAVTLLALKKATRTIPIVMLAIGDPVGVGAVASLARPGGNITGVSFISSDLAQKRVELLRAVAPRARTLAVLWDMRNANTRNESKAVEVAARGLGFSIRPMPIRSETDLAAALVALARNRPDTVYVCFEGQIVGSHGAILAQFGLDNRLPMVVGWTPLVDAGGLIAYAPHMPAIFARAAYFVDRILKGARPAELPIELPTRLELVVNLKTAKAIGTAIPGDLLLRADRVIE